MNNEKRIPLSQLTDDIAKDVVEAIRRYGYPSIAIMMVVHDSNSGEGVLSGNLKPEGMKALLEMALEQINIEPVVKPLLDGADRANPH